MNGLGAAALGHHSRPRPLAVPASKRPRLASRARAPPRAPHTHPSQPPAAKRPRLGLPAGRRAPRALGQPPEPRVEVADDATRAPEPNPLPPPSQPP